MPAKVLIADDDRLIAQLTEMWLRHAGFGVIVAYDGQGALNAAAKLNPDVVLLDIRMPKADGFEVLRAIKCDPALGHLPVIIFSAHVQETTRQRALEGGACQFLSKPFEPADLLAAIRDALAGRPTHRAAPPVAAAPPAREQTPAPSTRKKVLIADDDRALVGVLAARLTHAGYEVISTADGRYAFDRILLERPDLVILDIHMPPVGGFNVLERMYKLAGLDHIPVVYVSGDASPDIERTAIHFGAFALLRKPFEMDEFLATVRHALAREKGAKPK